MGKEIDRRVDIFAAGVALHETLTGRRLFQGENDLDTMRRITEMPVPDPSSIAPGVPAALDAVVQRALVRDPAGRYQTAAEFLDALEAAITLAPPREVGAYLQLKCAQRLEERRSRLKAVLEGRAEPLSVRLLPEVVDGANDSTVAPPAVQRRRALDSGESESQISQIAASIRDASVPPQKSGRLWLGLGAVALAVCLGVVAVWVAQHTLGTRVAATATRTREAITATPTLPPPPKQDEVDVSVITVRADARILTVQVPGAKRVEIERDRATLYVAPWTGVLGIDAVLEGGRRARANVDFGGANTDILLIPTQVQQLPAPQPQPQAQTALRPVRPPARPVPSAAPRTAPATKKTELQDNPYD
jgi:hypothetical protein